MTHIHSDNCLDPEKSNCPYIDKGRLNEWIKNVQPVKSVEQFRLHMATRDLAVVEIKEEP